MLQKQCPIINFPSGRILAAKHQVMPPVFLPLSAIVHDALQTDDACCPES